MLKRNSLWTRWKLGLTLAATALLASVSPRPASAAQTLRYTTDEHGDMTVFGNTFAHDCSTTSPVPKPLNGTVGDCGTNFNDTGDDVFWRSDSPAPGQVEASSTITPTMARTQAVFQLPAGATVLYARLYWQGQRVGGSDQVLFERPNVFSRTMTRDAVRGTLTADNLRGKTVFSSTADVTALLQQYGAGAYRVGILQQDVILNVDDDVQFANWYVVVFYRLDSQPTRNLALFDGFDAVSGGTSQTATLNGFLVPSAGYSARLMVVAHEGDVGITGDQMSFNGTVLSDAVNPANNFFNATRSYLGSAVSVAGDLPQRAAAVGGLDDFDMDIVDVTAQVAPGAKVATITASSSMDVFFLSTFATSISTLKPVFSSTNKTYKNLTRSDGTIKAGDVIEYTIVTSNTGSDTGINVKVTDPLPSQVTYVPGSISIDAVAKTDQTGDDQAEVTTAGAQQTLVARIGPGANAVTGGTIKVGDAPVTIKFRATINAGITGLVRNQAAVAAAGQTATTQGLPGSTSWSSGDGKNPTAPTDLVVGDPTDLQVTVKDNLNGALPVPGTPIVYTVDIKNLGPRDVTGASVVATLPQLPAGATVSWTCTAMGGGACPAASGIGPIDSNLLNLPSGANITYVVTVPNPAATPLVNPVIAVNVQPPTSIPDIKQANNTASTGATDLAIVIVDNLNGTAVKPNTPTVFTVTVTNKGPSAAQNIGLSNMLPPGVTAASVPWTCQATGGAVCPAAMGSGGLPAQGGAVPKNGQLVYTLTVPGQAAPSQGTFFYQVAVAAPSPLSDVDLSNNSATTGKADLQAAVRDNLQGRAPQPGMTVTYTLEVSNAGPNNVVDATLSTSLPQGITSPTWTCVATGGAVCPAASGVGTPPGLATLPAGGKLTYTISGSAPAAPLLPWAFSSTVTPPPTVADPNNGNNTASSIITGQQNGDLSIQITKSPDMAPAGEPTTYTAIVTNSGPDSVSSPTAVLNLPPGATVLMEPAGQGWTCTKQGGSYTCTQPNAPVGSMPPLVAQIVTPVPASQGGPGSTVVGIVGAPRVNDPDLSNNIAVVDAAGVPVTSADLALTITKNPNPSTLGQETTYTLQLDNRGPDTAQAPSIHFTLPPGSIVTAFMPGVGWNCVQNGLSFTCLRSDLMPGSAPPVVIKVVTPPPADGSQNAGAVVGEATAVQLKDPDPLNNVASIPVGNPAPTGSDLSVKLTRDPLNPGEGDTVTYTLQATNKGPDAVNNVTVTLTVPPGSQIIRAAAGDGWKCTQNLNTFVCTRPAVAQGDAPPVTVQVILPGLGANSVLPGIGGATASVSADNNTDQNPADNAYTLEGTQYQLVGGGAGCAAAGRVPGAPGAGSGLLLAALVLLGRRRFSFRSERNPIV